MLHPLQSASSCEPERAAAIQIRLEKDKAEALRACLETQQLELAIQRRRMLLPRGELAAFESVSGTSASDQVAR